MQLVNSEAPMKSIIQSFALSGTEARDCRNPFKAMTVRVLWQFCGIRPKCVGRRFGLRHGVSRHGCTLVPVVPFQYAAIRKLEQIRGIRLWSAIQCFWLFLAGNRVVRSQCSGGFRPGKSRKTRSRTSSTDINPRLTATARTWSFRLIAQA